MAPRGLALAALLVCSLMIPLGGCAQGTPQTRPTVQPLVWSEKNIEFQGATIDLGFREVAAPGRSVEPVAAITRDGAPIAGAMVFISLVASGGSESAQRSSDEASALYEPPGEQTPALYTAGELRLPEGAARPAVRFRIALPDAEEDFTREVPLP